MQPRSSFHGLQALPPLDSAPPAPIDDLLDNLLTSLPPSFPWPDLLTAASTLGLAGDTAAHPEILLSGAAGEFLDGGGQNEALRCDPAAAFNPLSQGQLSEGTFMIKSQAASAPGGPTAGTATAAQPKQKVRARRGQATDPHSIAERLRRVRISERMKSLQELVPNANKRDKASMLDEIIEYVKFLQVQVKLLSMSRLGGAAAVPPITAQISSQEAGDGRRQLNADQTADQTADPSEPSLTVTERRVAKLMEEGMGSAMQYLQGKGLCLMPISLAATISTTTASQGGISPDGSGSSPPSISMLTVKSSDGTEVQQVSRELQI